MAYGSYFSISSRALVFCRPCYGSIRDLPFSLRTPTIGHCGCVGAIAAPRSLVKPRKEESREFSGARRSKEKVMPWKKLDANEFGIQRSMIPESTRMVLNKLRNKGFQVYLVGGCVRDLILDRIPKDFDVITSAELKEVRKVFPRCQIVGRRFPICHVYVDDIIIEVSSFSTSARTGKAPNKSFRKPAGCSERDYIRWKNCLQRDFTVNGLMFDPSENVVYDYIGGVEDIRNSKVRTVSAANLSFVEDTARILRAIRIAARLGFSLTKEVAVSVKELSSSLLRLAPSRIRMELNYMMAYGSAEASLRLLWRFGIMEILLPIQASYFVSQGFRRRDGRSNMLLSLFGNLDRLVAPDRPSHEFLWIGILAFHKALVDQPRDPKIVASYCLAIYSELSLSEAIEIARTNSKQHNSNFQELSGHEKDIADSNSKLSQQVINFAESIKSAARKMNDRDYLANAMSKYPQAPGSDMVFMSKPLLERVEKMFGSVRRKGKEEREAPNLERRINYKSLALGDFHETRRVFARIVFDTVYPPT
uniref:Poly(A) polymerase I n=1 Tax=Noccaea caerulescens TaxID=107243 RepID=A0A1J3CQ33_NOCCA